ncbi:glycosyltransferase family 2 protein [Actinacidiphila guanduensis]|uniref:Glycosyltransferase, GT2 family n=1 Tax=Actinacidiphila guanduensis TaxID=310781 RepID=A0A1H0GTF6_9ACTN|nr:glycosyltransferase [Actinacidiphila guanduensis]SDO10114.1 Glycosyltransferase, GT2 family [Actinacidiphila guanduensis]
MTDTLDIMLPYYGDPDLMRGAVRSVLAQSDPDWRLTVVDDGREPGVPEWFAALGDDRVRYFRNEHNLGVTGNFLRCTELVDHPYTVLMGCDDLMRPGYVATLKAARAAEPGAAMYQPGVRVVDADGRPARTLVDTAKRHLYSTAPRSGRARLGGEDLAVSLLRGNWVYFPAMCWRSDVLKEVGFRTDLTVVQDLALMAELLLRGEEMVTDAEVCFDYRRHRGSESSAQAASGSRFDETRALLLELAADFDALGWHRAARTARRHLSVRLHALAMVPGALRHREWGAARALAGHVVARSHRLPRPVEAATR